MSKKVSLRNLKNRLRSYARPEKAKLLQGFFKTGPCEYAEGDVFLGVMVPQTRAVAKEFRSLGFGDLSRLIKSKFHEERLTALIILVYQFKKADEKTRKKLFRFYLNSTSFINNWDLVDLTAPHIVGAHLSGKDQSILETLARSKSLWERRIAMLSTFYYIQQGYPESALHIAEILLKDPHDLIHKAVGWMLREIGKRCSVSIEEAFLEKHCLDMPRTMLRYAIERFPEGKRKEFMKR